MMIVVKLNWYIILKYSNNTANITIKNLNHKLITSHQFMKFKQPTDKKRTGVLSLSEHAEAFAAKKINKPWNAKYVRCWHKITKKIMTLTTTAKYQKRGTPVVSFTVT